MPTLTPRIRRPSSHSLFSRRPSSSSSPKPLTPPLSPRLVLLLQALLALLVLWAEVGVFRFKAGGFFRLGGGCGWDDSPSVRGRVQTFSPSSPSSSGGGGGEWTKDDRWKLAASQGKKEGTPFHVLLAADPQLLDMHSYASEGRSWALRKLGVWVSDVYARKSWRAVLGSRTKGAGKGGGTGVDAVVWLGDLLDNTIEAVDPVEHAAYIHRFHLLFPLPRASISSFSPLSHTSSLPSSSSLIPPIPSIVLPGNHDLGLSSPSSPSSASASLGAYHRERFTAAFGPTYGEREWNGWRIVWVDAMALVEEEFWSGDEGGGEGGNYGGMKGWLEGMLKEPRTTPTVLLTHIPLFRRENTSCGSSRESSRPIRQGRGTNYQNELGERETKWLVERVGPTVVFSGDDHDACVIQHPFKSPLDGVTPVVETTVKAFSMAMGVRHPGYHLLSLYAPLPSSSLSPSDLTPSTPVSYTYTSTSCTLPDQLGIYLYLYLPLLVFFTLYFLTPKCFVATGQAISDRRRRGRHSRASSALANGAAVEKGTPRRAGGRRTAEEDVEDSEAEFGLYGGVMSHLLDDAASPIKGGGGGGRGGEGFLSDEEGGEGGEGEGSDENDFGTGEVLPFSRPGSGTSTPSRGGGGGGVAGHVRRVSRVWLWEGSAPPSSSSSSPFGSPSLDPSSSSSTSSPHPFSPSTLITNLFDRLLLSLSSNPLLLPLSRFFLRPLTRVSRAVWRRVGGPFAVLAKGLESLGGVGRGRGGVVGRVMGETVSEVVEVARPAVGVWVAVMGWYSV